MRTIGRSQNSTKEVRKWTSTQEERFLRQTHAFRTRFEEKKNGIREKKKRFFFEFLVFLNCKRVVFSVSKKEC